MVTSLMEVRRFYWTEWTISFSPLLSTKNKFPGGVLLFTSDDRGVPGGWAKHRVPQLCKLHSPVPVPPSTSTPPPHSHSHSPARRALSGLAWKHSIDVCAGVIDADYRGPVGVILFRWAIGVSSDETLSNPMPSLHGSCAAKTEANGQTQPKWATCRSTIERIERRNDWLYEYTMSKDENDYVAWWNNMK